MPYSISAQQTGGPEVLIPHEINIAEPSDEEVLIQHTAIGLNFIDTYHRTGLYPVETKPFTPGLEAAGIIKKTGRNVSRFKEGDRIGYCTGPIGAYATHRNIAADKIIALPDNITDEIAAASMLKGMTAEYLIRRTYEVQPGQTVLFHAISGGVGAIACQWLKHIGATIIGTAGSKEKAEMAKNNGCDHVIRYDRDDFVEAVQDITHGKGVPVVYDSVGKDTFEGSINCLSPRGMMVSFGNASGPVPAIEPLLLTQKGSLYITRPSLMAYTATYEEYAASAAALFDMIASGAVKIHIGQTYALKDAAKAHTDLEARKTSGSSLLLP